MVYSYNRQEGNGRKEPEMFAKTYSRKQMGVVYRAMKEGKLSIDKADVSYLYDMADGMQVWNTNDSSRAEKLHYGMRVALDAIFAGEYKTAQRAIDNMVAA